MKYRCDDCNGYHDTSDLTINIGGEGYKVIDDINEAVTLAAVLEHTKQVGLDLGNKTHRIEMIVQVARNDVINDINKKVEG
jgi:hypothetical protein